MSSRSKKRHSAKGAAWKAAKRILKALPFSSEILPRLQAERMARSNKRLDICAMQFAHNFHLAGNTSLSGKVCLEIGAGWVLSHTLVCYLLGARKVIATDILPLARPEALAAAIRFSTLPVVRDILSPFEDHSLLRERIDRLQSMRNYRLDRLKDLGIEYAAPTDFSSKPFDEPVDFIFSNAVLQLIPRAEVTRFLQNALASLQPGGRMIHCLHLEDFRNPNTPFAFLGIPSSAYGQAMETGRGNRIRKSEWERRFHHLSGSRSRTLYQWVRRDAILPHTVDPSIEFQDETDLKTSHIGVLTEHAPA